MNRKFLSFLIFSLIVFTAVIGYPALSSQDDAIEAGDLVLSSADFKQGSGENISVNDSGLSLAGTGAEGIYLSPVLDAPLAYNAVVPQWLADIPAGSTLEIRLRTGSADGRWSEWFEIHESPDWNVPEDEDVVGQMITVPAADVTHIRLQYAVQFSRWQAGATPLLRQLRLTFIDSTRGPTAAELVARQQELDGGPAPQAPDSSYPKPAVVSRQVWCTHAACNYSPSNYYPVSHLILHHTVSSNSSSDWAATVRAIWHFHTFTRNWGDVGYNYLVDMNGVIYEGRLGGDDVVGVHASGANRGSMALALVGTFTLPSHPSPGITPPQPMLNAAAELFAWKAAHKNIDVYSAGRVPDLSWGLPFLMGHRDVYGTTECPGEQAHLLLPWLRHQVAQRTGFVSPYTYIDEQSSAFTKSSATWYTPIYNCGFNLHAYYAWSTTNPAQSSNWGEWRIDVPTSGRYELSVYVPRCRTGRAETNGARYTVTHANGADQVTTSHENDVGMWIVLGEYDFLAGNSGHKLRLTNLTTTDSGLGVWFDAIRLRPVEAPVSLVNHQPTPQSWLNQRAVAFSWQVENGILVTELWLQAATDPAFDSPIFSSLLPPNATHYSYTFDQDYPELYWRVIALTAQGGSISSAPTRFAIDTAAPESQISGVYELPDERFVIVWQGDSNGGSPVVYYDVDYRPDGDPGEWIPWRQQTPATGALFIPPAGNGYQPVYWFRVRAYDLAGNNQPFPPGGGDVHTGQAIFLSHAIMLPVVQR
jgi:hypothetical protein